MDMRQKIGGKGSEPKSVMHQLKRGDGRCCRLKAAFRRESGTRLQAAAALRKDFQQIGQILACSLLSFQHNDLGFAHTIGPVHTLAAHGWSGWFGHFEVPKQRRSQRAYTRALAYGLAVKPRFAMQYSHHVRAAAMPLHPRESSGIAAATFSL